MIKRHRHEWGYVETVTEKVQREVWHASPVGALCIHCHKLRPDLRRSRPTPSSENQQDGA